MEQKNCFGNTWDRHRFYTYICYLCVCVYVCVLVYNGIWVMCMEIEDLGVVRAEVIDNVQRACVNTQLQSSLRLAHHSKRHLACIHVFVYVC